MHIEQISSYRYIVNGRLFICAGLQRINYDNKSWIKNNNASQYSSCQGFSGVMVTSPSIHMLWRRVVSGFIIHLCKTTPIVRCLRYWSKSSYCYWQTWEFSMCGSKVSEEWFPNLLRWALKTHEPFPLSYHRMWGDFISASCIFNNELNVNKSHLFAPSRANALQGHSKKVQIPQSDKLSVGFCLLTE